MRSFCLSSGGGCSLLACASLFTHSFPPAAAAERHQDGGTGGRGRSCGSTLNSALGLTGGVRGPRGGSGLLVALTVAGGQGLGHGGGGALAGLAAPAQCELQRGTLGEALERGQALRRRSEVKQRPPRLPPCPPCTHLPVQDGLPRRPLLVDGTLLRLLHGHLVLSVQQLQPSATTGEVSACAAAAALLRLRCCCGSPPPPRLSLTCSYRRRSSEPRRWCPPPAGRSSCASCSPPPPPNLHHARRKKGHGTLTTPPAHSQQTDPPSADVSIRNEELDNLRTRDIKKSTFFPPTGPHGAVAGVGAHLGRGGPRRCSAR